MKHSLYIFNRAECIRSQSNYFCHGNAYQLINKNFHHVQKYLDCIVCNFFCVCRYVDQVFLSKQTHIRAKVLNSVARSFCFSIISASCFIDASTQHCHFLFLTIHTYIHTYIIFVFPFSISTVQGAKMDNNIFRPENTKNTWRSINFL